MRCCAVVSDQAGRCPMPEPGLRPLGVTRLYQRRPKASSPRARRAGSGPGCRPQPERSWDAEGVSGSRVLRAPGIRTGEVSASEEPPGACSPEVHGTPTGTPSSLPSLRLRSSPAFSAPKCGERACVFFARVAHAASVEKPLGVGAVFVAGLCVQPALYFSVVEPELVADRVDESSFDRLVLVVGAQGQIRAGVDADLPD